jgi:hypothetical protein
MKTEITIAIFDTIADRVNRAEPRLMATARSALDGYYVNGAAVLTRLFVDSRFADYRPILKIMTFTVQWQDDDETASVFACEGYVHTAPKQEGVLFKDGKPHWPDQQQAVQFRDSAHFAYIDVNIYDNDLSADDIAEWSLDQARRWLLYERRQQ